MPVKRTGDKQQPPPSKRDMPRKGPLSASESFVPPEFAREDTTKVWQKPYRCSCCNREYDSQQGNFYKTRSDLYSAANGYATVCKKCLDSYYTHSVALLRNDEHQALLHIAQMLDWYVSDQLIDDILANPSTKKPVGELARRLSIKGAPEGTYLDAIVDGVVSVSTVVSDDAAAEPEQREADPRAVELFGPGYDPEEYDILIQHYDMLAQQFPTVDYVQDSSLKDLCFNKLLQYQSRGDPDKFVKLVKSYQETLSSTGLKQKSVSDYADEESATWGQFIAQVERLSPADLYEQEELYKDMDGIGDYIQRFFTRSTLNYFGKTNEKDPEYSLTDEEINGDVT